MLLAQIKQIEVELGRTPTVPNGPRVVDIDILCMIYIFYLLIMMLSYVFVCQNVFLNYILGVTYFVHSSLNLFV